MNEELIKNENPTEQTKDAAKEAYAQFQKSVLAVAEAFFAMSKEEREAMVDYVKNKEEYD